MACHCQIIPPDVLARLANDKKLSQAERADIRKTIAVDAQMRLVREANASLTASSFMMAANLAPPTKKPAFKLYDCQHGNVLPGLRVAKPQASADRTVKRTYATTVDVWKFFNKVFARNSLDGLGMDLLSSVHYGTNYNNAFWNGQQMTYGDGDQKIFVDFSRGNDVVGHELTHGLTQFTSQFAYQDEAGGLNESMSDVFGTMFRQWQAKQNVNSADWLIGSDIMGPLAKANGYTCLRDLADPGATHALAPQPKHFSKYHNGMNPHESSGIPNQAFYLAAKAIGGKSWEKAGRVWFDALVNQAPAPTLTMKQFADRTRTAAQALFASQAAVYNAVNQAWLAVGL